MLNHFGYFNKITAISKILPMGFIVIILMMENFARKFNLQIKYVEYSRSLNELFNKKETIEEVPLENRLQ